ncbi:MAG TPA: penicillin-insensitive murein endopeptidase [Candidatus Limnocylindrales bacterium]|nr:penicillin-insensitive murein endopeptidase [Candidatus Limnocylindrales bacterium]
MFRPRTPHRIAWIALALVALIALAGTAGPALAAVSTFYPTQSPGDRGTDVRALQHLLNANLGRRLIRDDGRVAVVARELITIPVDGIYGPATVDAVRAIQSRRGLPQTGIADQATWRAIVIPVAEGARNEAVLAAQRILREKRAAGVPLDGNFDAITRSAVVAFQQHLGLSASGTVDAATWRALLWHFELPQFSSAALCDYSVGNGPANWGTSSATAWIEAAGAVTVKAGYGRVAVGDVSLEHGGDIPGHETHERGLDVDLRLMRDANDQCTRAGNYRLASYDRTATRALVKAIRAVAPGHVKLIYFNDPVLVGEGLTRARAGHDDHLHVRFCEASHPVAAYDC